MSLDDFFRAVFVMDQLVSNGKMNGLGRWLSKREFGVACLVVVHEMQNKDVHVDIAEFFTIHKRRLRVGHIMVSCYGGSLKCLVCHQRVERACTRSSDESHGKWIHAE
jgi:hypothetical protein